MKRSHLRSSSHKINYPIMLKSTFKVNYNFFNVTQFMYFKIDNIPNLIKKSLHMIHFTKQIQTFRFVECLVQHFCKKSRKKVRFSKFLLPRSSCNILPQLENLWTCLELVNVYSYEIKLIA